MSLKKIFLPILIPLFWGLFIVSCKKKEAMTLNSGTAIESFKVANITVTQTLTRPTAEKGGGRIGSDDIKKDGKTPSQATPITVTLPKSTEGTGVEITVSTDVVYSEEAKRATVKPASDGKISFAFGQKKIIVVTSQDKQNLRYYEVGVDKYKSDLVSLNLKIGGEEASLGSQSGTKDDPIHLKLAVLPGTDLKKISRTLKGNTGFTLSQGASITNPAGKGYINLSSPQALEVTAEDGRTKKYYQVNLTFSSSSLAIAPTRLTLKPGEERILTPTVLPSHATNKNVTWISDDHSVATVVKGRVTAVGVGTATITVTSVADNTKKATATIKVSIPVESMKLNQGSLSLTYNGTGERLIATVLPHNATNKNVIWSSSDKTKVTVVNGAVVPVTSGQVVITATSEADSTKKATAIVVVKKVPLTDFKYKSNKLTGTAGVAISPSSLPVLQPVGVQVTYSIAGDSNGLTVNAEGLVSGTPIRHGTGKLVVVATAKENYSGTAEVTMSYDFKIRAYQNIPSGLKAVAGAGGKSITLSWSAFTPHPSEETIMGYTLYYAEGARVTTSSSSIRVNGKNTQTKRMTGLKPWTQYSFTIVARGATGSTRPSAVTTVQTLSAATPPGSPKALAGRTTGATEANITWIAPDDAGKLKNGTPATITGYRLIIASNAAFSGSLTQVDVGHVSSYRYTFKENKKYYIAIQVKNNNTQIGKQYSARVGALEFKMTPHYLTNMGEQTILYKRTKLLWTYPVTKTTVMFNQVYSACQSLNFAGYDNWYMPSEGEFNEMLKTVPLGETRSTFPSNSFWLWTSTPSGKGGHKVASLYNGTVVSSTYSTNDTYRLNGRCVRRLP